MRTAPPLRPLSALSLAAALALLSGCSPCDYTVDASNPHKPLQESESYKGSGFTKEQYEKMQRENAEADARRTPEQRAKIEEIKRQLREESARRAKEREAKIAAGYDPAKDPMVRFRKPTLTECSIHYGASAILWLLGVLVIGWAANVASRVATGRSLISWLTGRQPT